MEKGIEIFCCYAHNDQLLLSQLRTHLASLVREGLITVWHDAGISPAKEWEQEIAKHLNSADIILLLISPDFMASEYCYNVEMRRAVERHERGETRVIPLILRPVFWQKAPFDRLQALPSSAKPITKWRNRDEAFVNVVNGLQRTIQEVKNLTDRVSSSALSFPSPIWTVPYQRNPFFTGREDILERLHQSLTSSYPIALTQPLAINGLGGIGKTQIAVEYAYRFSTRYTTVLWLAAASQETLLQGLTQFVRLLRLPMRLVENQKDRAQELTLYPLLSRKEAHPQNEATQELIQAFRYWLETHDQWLLILDNADDIHQIRDFLPSVAKGHTLLTTRATYLGDVAREITVKSLGTKEGMLLLLRRAKILSPDSPLEDALNNFETHDRNDAQEIVELLGGLPLAIDQAGAYIGEKGCNLTDYLEYYRFHQKELLQERGSAVIGHPDPVTTTWSLNFEQVGQISPAAAQLLSLCAFFSPDSIPNEFLKQGAPIVCPELKEFRHTRLFDEAMKVYLNYSLVSRDRKTKTLSIHRLVQAMLRDGLDETQQRFWAERAVKVVSHVFPSGDGKTWLLCEKCLPHIQASAMLIKQWKMQFNEAIDLLERASSYLAQHSRVAKLFQKLSHSIREQKFGPDHITVANSFRVLGDLDQDQAHYAEAESNYRRALSIYTQQQETNDLAIGHLLKRLGDVYHKQDREELATSHYWQALIIYERKWGSDYLYTICSPSLLAELYHSKDHPTTGHYEQANELYQYPLGIHERLEPLNIADRFLTLAEIYSRLQGLEEQSISAYQRAIAIQEREGGPNYCGLEITCHNLANIYVAQEKYELAESLYQRALDICKSTRGPDHPEAAFKLRHLAILYSRQGQYEQAIEYLLQAREVANKFAPNHPEVILSLKGLIELYKTIEKHEEAETLIQSLSAIYRRYYPSLESSQ